MSKGLSKEQFNSLFGAMEGISWPIKKQALIEEFGDRLVRISPRRFLPFAVVASLCPRQVFHGPLEIINCPQVIQRFHEEEQAA